MFKIKVILIVASIAILVSFGIVLLTRLHTVNERESKQQEQPRESENNYGAVRYQTFADFKTSSRRKQYRIGDLISFELSMRNDSPNQVRLLNIDIDNRIVVRDSQGIEIGVFAYSSFHTLSPSFSVLNAGEYVTKNLRFFAGCDRLRRQMGNKEKESRKDVIPISSNGCFELKALGKYSVSAKISNTYVESGHTIQTAVGEIESAPFEITITE